MKKHISYIILAGVLFATLSFVFPANAQTVTIPTVTMDKPISEMSISELQAKISELTQAIQQLQALLLQLTGQAPDISGIPGAYIFNTNLKYGTSSIDVKYLQIFLNADPDTRVSSTGWGSPGKESMYFGPKTKQAVIKFQEKYASETLTPWNLTQGTGFVGQTTRAQINQLLAQYRTGDVPLSPTPPTSEVTCGPADNICPSGCTYSQDTDCSYCGDNIIQTPNSEGIHEVCDANNLNNQTCIIRGYASGNLSCSNDCLTFNVSACLLAGGGSPSPGGGVPAPEPEPEPVCGAADGICPSGCTHAQDPDCTYCGDNIIQSPNNEGIDEVCDGTSLAEETCITKGFPGGDLACSSDCLTFNTADCTSPSPLNDPPVLDPIGNKTVNENQELSFTISAADPNNDTLSYSVQDLPTGAVFNPDTQTFIWTPTYDQSGTYSLTFIVSDGSLTDSEEITITVSNINRAPVLAPIGDKSIDENQTLSFTISATDPDGDPPTYSIQGLVSGVTFQDQTFTWTPTYEQSGAYIFTFIVSDGELTDSETITITVNDVCVPTTCSELGYECGTWDDGCGGTLNCGTCESGYTCTSGQCIQDTPAPFCGDGSCNGTETCSTCPQDCGICPMGKTYYLDVNGDDTADGLDWNNAWKTIARAMPNWSGGGNTVTSGDTVMIKDGTYGRFELTTHTGTDWITYQAEEGHTPVIKPTTGNNYYYVYIGRTGTADAANQYIKFDGITFEEREPMDSGRHMMTLNNANYVEFENCRIGGTYYTYKDNTKALYISHSNYIDINNCTSYGLGEADENGNKGFQFIIYGLNSNNVTISDCNLTDSQIAIVAWGRNWTITNCEIHDLHSDGIQAYGIADSVIEDSSVYNIFIPPYQDPADFHCDCIQFWTNYEPGHPDYVYTENIIIRGNRLYNSTGQIILWNGFVPEVPGGPGSNNITIENNLIYGGDAWDMMLYDTHNLTFINNTVAGDVIFRAGMQLSVMANNILDRADFIDGAIVDYEDYNIINNYGVLPPEYVQGEHTIELEDDLKFKNLFKDYDNYNFSPIMSSVACPGGNSNLSEGEYIGAFPCVPECLGGETRLCPKQLGVCVGCVETCIGGIWPGCDDSTYLGCNSNYENPEVSCENGIDNDCNGFDLTCLPVGIPGGYISWWRFEGNVDDETRKNDGTIAGNPQYVLGVDGTTALEFDGDGDYVDVGSDASLELTDTLTIIAWVNVANPGGQQETICAKSDGTADTQWEFFVTNTNGTLAFAANKGGSWDNSTSGGEGSDTALTANKWEMVAVTYNSATDGALYYLNGSLDGNNPTTGALNQQDSIDVLLGARGPSNPQLYLTGQIDEVMIYSRALSASEIQDVYDAQKPAEIAMEETELKGLASILDAIKNILKRIQELF